MTTQLGLWLGLNHKTYKRFHNLIIKTDNGTTEIDTVILSKFGIFVIEIKDYSGWIFGSEEQPYWTQTFRKSKQKFQNPLRQNYRHTKALSSSLGIEQRYFHSIVYFSGEAQLKTQMPPNVMKWGLLSYIKSFKEVLLTNNEITHLEEQLNKIQATQISRKQHIQNLNNRFNSTSICPKCGKPLTQRIAKKGPNLGKPFLACTGYPQCRYTKSI